MKFDQDNKVVKLCAEGMRFEGKGNEDQAIKLFLNAWDEASDDQERFTAAHYVARHQKTVADKLEWDTRALEFALKIKDESAKSIYPSLHLNIAKGYEDLKDYQNAKIHYQLARSFKDHLAEDGYGAMINRGIIEGLNRISQPV